MPVFYPTKKLPETLPEVIDLSEYVILVHAMLQVSGSLTVDYADGRILRERLHQGPVKIKVAFSTSNPEAYVTSTIFTNMVSGNMDGDSFTIFADYMGMPLMVCYTLTDSKITYSVRIPVTQTYLEYDKATSNGGFLQMVNGAWTAVALTDVSEEGA